MNQTATAHWFSTYNESKLSSILSILHHSSQLPSSSPIFILGVGEGRITHSPLRVSAWKMVSNYLLLEEPMRMATILEPSKPVRTYFLFKTCIKIVSFNVFFFDFSFVILISWCGVEEGFEWSEEFLGCGFLDSCNFVLFFGVLFSWSWRIMWLGERVLSNGWFLELDYDFLEFVQFLCCCCCCCCVNFCWVRMEFVCAEFLSGNDEDSWDIRPEFEVGWGYNWLS